MVVATAVMYSDIWRWSVQVALPPNNGQVRSDTAAWLDTANVFIAKLSDAGTDTTDALAAVVAGDGIYLRHKTDPTRWVQFQTTAPSTDSGTYFSIPVTYQDGAGNDPISGTQIVVELLVPGVEGEVADWTMVQVEATRWLSLVDCVHGHSQSGVYLNRPIQDDRNFLEQADPAFANHQSLFPECDCALNLEWQPTYSPPDPPIVELQSPASAEATPQAVGATFTLWRMYPKLYGGTVVCQHGWTQSGVWMGASDWPVSQTVQDSTFQNHQRLWGCTDAIPLPSAIASATFLPHNGVPRTTQVALGQTPGTLASPFVVDGLGRLSVTVAGLLTVSATFSLNLSIVNGGGGAARLRLPPAASPNLTVTQATSVGLTDANDHATATIGYSAQVAANTSVEIDYVNVSGFVQDVQGGTLTVGLQ